MLLAREWTVSGSERRLQRRSPKSKLMILGFRDCSPRARRQFRRPAVVPLFRGKVFKLATPDVARSAPVVKFWPPKVRTRASSTPPRMRRLLTRKGSIVSISAIRQSANSSLALSDYRTPKRELLCHWRRLVLEI